MLQCSHNMSPNEMFLCSSHLSAHSNLVTFHAEWFMSFYTFSHNFVSNFIPHIMHFLVMYQPRQCKFQAIYGHPVIEGLLIIMDTQASASPHLITFLLAFLIM
jgi:hypothetical protein